MNALNIFWAVIYHCSIMSYLVVFGQFGMLTRCSAQKNYATEVYGLKNNSTIYDSSIDLKITLSIFDNALSSFLFTKCELTLFDSCLVSLWSGPALLTSYSLRRWLSATDILRKCNIYISGLRSEALTLLCEQAVCHEQWQTMSHFPVTCWTPSRVLRWWGEWRRWRCTYVERFIIFTRQ